MVDWHPTLARGAMLRHDSTRAIELLVMPERVLHLNGAAAAILRLCDGSRTRADIIGELAERFPDSPIASDVPPFLDRFRTEGWLR